MGAFLDILEVMSAEVSSILVAVIAAAIPACVTLITHFAQKRRARRDTGGVYILLLVIEDELNWEHFGRIPSNYDAIAEEYEDYHKAGGNGKITEAVTRYKEWHTDVNKQILEGTAGAGKKKANKKGAN